MPAPIKIILEYLFALFLSKNRKWKLFLWDPILKIVVAEGKKFFETDKRKFRTIKLVQKIVEKWFKI